MKIKKSKTMAAQPGSGSAAIADRFRLDTAPAASASTATISKNAAFCALVAGFISLTLAGILTFMLYDHWAYLMRA